MAACALTSAYKSARILHHPKCWRSNNRLTLLQPSCVIKQQKASFSAILYQKNRKGTEEDPPKPPLGKRLKYGLKNFGPELKLFFKEKKEEFTTNPVISLEHGNYEIVYRFNTKASVEKWIVTADKDNAGGQSTANFIFTKNRTGLFHGNLCKEVPKDGITKYAGYANITSPKPMKSFGRPTHMDWSLFNCLLLRVRGDGRPYMIVIGCDFFFDVMWLNRWSCPLYTRGGPYWQMVKIPFANFFTSHHGRIQDKQEYPPLTIVNSFGITIGDAAEGPYQLEIDSIALMYDVNLSGKHAYEMYQNKYYEVQV